MTPKLTPREQLIDDRLAALAERAQQIEERQKEILDLGHRLMKGLNELAGYTLTTTQRQGAIAANVDVITRVLASGLPEASEKDKFYHRLAIIDTPDRATEIIEVETDLKAAGEGG